MTEFHAFLTAMGLRPKSIRADGRWHRCPTDAKPRSDNGAYKLMPDLSVGWGQDWQTMTFAETWWPDRQAKIRGPTEAERQRMLERARVDSNARATAKRQAYRAYERAAPLRGSHAYLDAHGLGMTGCYGLRVDASGWLVVPAYRGKWLQTIQRIAPDGMKRFWPGAPVSKAYYLVRRRTPRVTVFCEGLATGLAIYAAVPFSEVVVCFSAGNLVKVAETWEPNGLTVVCADNDHETEARTGKNPGIEAGEAAARALGCSCAAPEGIDGTDWSDWLTAKIEELPANPYAPHTSAVEATALMSHEIMGFASFRRAR